MPKQQTQDLMQHLIHDLQDLYDAEKQLVRALPKIAKACSNEELRNAVTEHLEVTRGQVQRLEQCFQQLGQKAKNRPCKGMKGILEEGNEVLQEDMEEAVMDAAIAAGGRKIEHYEMVGYESARSVAEQLESGEVAELLGETLREEQEADRMLTEICQQILTTARSGGDGGMEENADEEAQPARARTGARTQTRAASSSRSKTASSRQSSGKTAAKSSGKNSGGKKKASAGGLSRSASSSGGGSDASSHPLTDHEEIREWAESRGAHPACVKGTGKKGGIGMIRLDFPGYTGADSLQPVEWDQWFESFDQNGLALLVQEKTAGGQRSNFNKLVKREASQQKPKTRAAH